MTSPLEAMKVREAAPADQDAVVALWSACGLVAPHNDPAVDFRLAIEGAASAVLVTEAADRAMIGAIMVGHDGHRGWLYYVAVESARRRAGIGRTLVVAAEEWLRARGLPKVQLMIRETNPQAAGFYAKLGFEPMPRINLQKWLRS